MPPGDVVFNIADHEYPSTDGAGPEASNYNTADFQYPAAEQYIPVEQYTPEQYTPPVEQYAPPVEQYAPPTSPPDANAWGVNPAPQTPLPPYQPPTPAHGTPAYAPIAAAPDKPKGGSIAIIAVVIVAILAAAIGIAVAMGAGGQTRGPGSGGQTTSTSSAPRQANSAAGAVQGFLDALAAGNAADALAYAATQPDDTTFLTDQVLAASQAIAPITNINVHTGGTTSSTVSASYQLGTKSVNASFGTTKDGNTYKLTAVTTDLSVSSGLAAYSALLNGVPIGESGSITVFPGAYRVTVDNSFLTVTDGDFTVVDPEGYFGSKTISVDLADDAQSKLQTAATSALRACMAEKATTTSCGFGGSVTSAAGKAVAVDKNTIKWSFSALSPNSGDFSKTAFSYAVFTDDPFTASAIHVFILTCSGKDTKGNAFNADQTISKVMVDFSDPEHLKVTFS